MPYLFTFRNPCTMCKITHFARKMGGQNFRKFNGYQNLGTKMTVVKNMSL